MSNVNVDISRFTTKHPGELRPYIAKDGKGYIKTFKGGDPTNPKNYAKTPTNNAILRYDEWRQLDEAVVRAGLQRLIGFQDLRDFGLVYPLNNAMATTVLTYERLSEAMEAEVNINPVRRTPGDAPVYETAHLPIPVVHADFTINERLLQESRMRGQALDTTSVEAAARKIAEKYEDMLFGASSLLSYGGGTIFTYQTESNINTVSLSENWDASGKTAAEILDDVHAMKQALVDDRHAGGPLVLYVPSAYDRVLGEDYSVSGASMQTIRQRILAIEGIERVQVVDRLTANTCLMVRMTSDVVDLVDGIPLQTIQWDTEGGMVHNYKLISIQVPRVKSDYNDRSGVVKLS